MSEALKVEAWRREWAGDDSDLGHWIYVEDASELDTDGPWQKLADHTTATAQIAQRDREVEELRAKVASLRQAYWDARAAMGFDNDGDPTPAALLSPMEDLMRQDAESQREDYQSALRELAAAEAQVAQLRADAERKDEAMEKLRQWALAYPLSVFPEPDFAKAHEVLSAAGMTIDSISASNMRHVITQVVKILDAAIDSVREG